MLSSLDDLMFRTCLDVDITSLLQLPTHVSVER